MMGRERVSNREMNLHRSSPAAWHGIPVLIVLAILLAALAGCGDSDSPGYSFRILSSSENRAIEPLVQEFADREHATIEVTYMGSVDIMRELANGANSVYDAVWPANSLWITLGDTTSAVQIPESIMRSPIVLGVKLSVAERLGWTGSEVSVNAVLAAAEAGQLTFTMANATQSDSGAAAYLAFLYAFAGQPDVLSAEDLQSPDLRDKITRILGTVSRTSGSSGFLKDLFINEYDSFDAMINQESIIIETNQELVRLGREPLYAVYLRDGTAIADSPLGYIDKGDAAKRARFRALQEYFLSDPIQRRLLELGRRTGFGVNPDPEAVDPAVFNPDWGIDIERVLTPIRLPSAAVIREALDLYHVAFRKPSFTVYALDFSDSMERTGEEELTAAMRQLLDQQSASQYLLQASPGDITVVIPFNDNVIGTWAVSGNNPADFQALFQQIDNLDAYGGTDIYQPVIEALTLMRDLGIDGYAPSIVLLTDGRNQSESTLDDLTQFIAESGMGAVPVFAITFGDASEAQLAEIADTTAGAVFDGDEDLIGAFRTVRGYS
jgi:Ca-activated chloride channel family protein